MDLLQDHLARAHASGGVFARTVAAPPWGLRLPGSIQLALHAVVQGRAWLWLDDPQASVELAPGELALVRGGPDHHIAHEPGAACLEPAEFKARHAHGGHSDDRRPTVFLCGAYRFSGDVGEGLLGALPRSPGHSPGPRHPHQLQDQHLRPPLVPGLRRPRAERGPASHPRRRRARVDGP